MRVGAPTATLPSMPVAPVFQTALGQAVKARRLSLGLTQEEIALHSDLHQRWISNVETGKRNPSYASLRRLAAALQMSASEMIALAEEVEAQLPQPRANSKVAAGR